MCIRDSVRSVAIYSGVVTTHHQLVNLAIGGRRGGVFCCAVALTLAGEESYHKITDLWYSSSVLHTSFGLKLLIIFIGNYVTVNALP